MTGKATGRFLGRPEGAYPGYVPPATADRPVVRQRPRSRAGRLWLVQAVTGAALLAVLAVHLVAQHLIAPGGLRDYASVVDYLRHPLAVVTELLLLGSVIVHASLGVRASLVDVLGERALRWASVVIAVIGAVALGYGLWLTAAVVGATGT